MKIYVNDLTYRNEDKEGSRGQIDKWNLYNSELEKTTGLQPTYAISGYITKLLEDVPMKNFRFRHKQPNALNQIIDKKTLEAINEIKIFVGQFVQKFRCKNNEIEYPNEIKRYADSKCKKCYGRGIISWKSVFEGDQRHINDILVEPVLCPCVDLKKIIEVNEAIENEIIDSQQNTKEV
jgi:hypothetical protein